MTWLHLWCLVHCPHKKNPFCRSTYPPLISDSDTLNVCGWDPLVSFCCVVSIVTGSAHLHHFLLDNHFLNVCTGQYQHCHHLGMPFWCWPTSCRYILCSQCKPGCRQYPPHNKKPCQLIPLGSWEVNIVTVNCKPTIEVWREDGRGLLNLNLHTI